MIVSLNPPFRTEFDLSRDPGEQSPVRVEPEMAERLDRFRSLEASYMGGLWIRKTDTAGMTITGHISLPDGEAPYLTLADASRYPIDPRNRRELPIQKTVAAGEAFEAHFLPLDELASLGPHLRVTEGGRTIALESDHPGPPLRITRLPMSTLSPAAISEVEKQMRALGYLGGGP